MWSWRPVTPAGLRQLLMNWQIICYINESTISDISTHKDDISQVFPQFLSVKNLVLGQIFFHEC